MVIVDTSVWVDYFRGAETPETDWLDSHRHGRYLGITDLNLCELLQGARTTREAEKIQLAIHAFDIFTTGGEVLAAVSAQNYRLLRSRSITVRSTIDCVVATFCIENGHSLLHRDRDFDSFERYLGLRVVHPAASPLQ
jgi:predicted nucleic acid-binding protein